MVGGNAMIKTVYCHLHGGYGDLYIVLRGSNMGCAACRRWGMMSKGCTASAGDTGFHWGTLHRQRGLDPGWQLLWGDRGGQGWQSIAATSPSTSPRWGDLGCVGLLVLGAGAVVPGHLPCQDTGVLLLLSVPKELRTVPETNFPPHGSCVGQTNTP